MKRLVYSYLALILIAPLPARTWKSTDGKTLEAEFISSANGEVTLKRDSDGKQFTLPISRLSDDDKIFIEQQGSTPPAAQDPSDTAEAKPIEGEYAKLVTGEWELAEHKNLPYAFYGGKDLDGGKKYPLVISLHGKSKNNENGKQIGFAKKFASGENYAERPCLILAPLCYQPHGGTGGGWNDAPGAETLDLVEKLIKKLPVVDEDRVYVIGYSMGGFGTWHFLKSESRMFAAGIPIAGYSSGVGKLRSMPIWAFHGAEDAVVKVDGARRAAEELKRSKVFKYTEFPDEGHGIAGKVTSDEEVHRWLFEQKKR